MSDDVKAKVQSQFGAASEAYATSPVHARGESLRVLMELVQPQPDWRVLDIATGAGHTALTFAPHVAHVFATDLTKEMVNKVEELATARGITNIDTKLADAEQLPFGNASFDLVTCRLGFHHFPNPHRALSEFARVLKRGGILGLTDNITVEDTKGHEWQTPYVSKRHAICSKPLKIHNLRVNFVVT